LIRTASRVEGIPDHEAFVVVRRAYLSRSQTLAMVVLGRMNGKSAGAEVESVESIKAMHTICDHHGWHLSSA
jgi:hypothetical protein